MARRQYLTILSVLTAVIMVFSMMPFSSFAIPEEPGEMEDTHHYLVFASDLHADPDNLFGEAKSVFSRALNGFPEEFDFMSLLGDIAGDGTESPEYKASDIYGAAAESTMTEDWHLLEQYFSVICSDHDGNVVQDVAGNVFLKGDASEEVYKGITHDGETFCYVYGVGFDGMAKGGQAGKESAEIFKHWIKNKDVTIPVFVVSHLPVQALCGDNPGAYYWNEALNFAATGVEGITGLDDSHTIIRNIVFLSGHNHIRDAAEYVFRAGTSMPVQEDSSEEGVQSTESSIYFTSITPGYLCESGNATLLDITEESFTFTKYNNGSAVSLGTDGTTGEAMETSLSIPQFKKSDPDGPVVAKQPENRIVSYPDGATFSVEMEKPDEVASYQWYMLDKEDQQFFLEGSSAHTDTLIIPATIRMNQLLRFYCLITGKDGKRTATRMASLDLDNRDEKKPVFYVGEYALEPGESMDLSAVDIGDGYKLGSGRVSFGSNASDITVENLVYDNSHTTGGLALAPNVGLDLEYEDPELDEYNVIFHGDNRIINTYYDYNYNLGGIPFDFYIVGNGAKPLINFIGDGTLSVTNGYNAIRVIGDLMIGVDITILQDRPEYADGIAANHILVSEGRKLDLNVNGFAFNAKGNLFMKDADVNIVANTPHISNGTVTKSTLAASGAISIENTRLDIQTVTDQKICGNAAGCNIIHSDGELFITNGSEVSCEARLTGDGYFASGFTGISTLNGYVEDAAVSVKLNSENCFESMGLYAEEDFQFLNSALTVDIRSGGTAYGAAVERDFNAEDSVVNVASGFYEGAMEGNCYGLVCENAVFKVTDPQNTISFKADGGIALACDLGRKASPDPFEFEEGYQAENVYLRDGTLCLVPEKNAVNLASIPVPGVQGMQYVPIETIYDSRDTGKPSEEVVFGIEDSGNPPAGSRFPDVPEDAWYYDAVNWAVDHDPQITKGTSATAFSPEETCHRGQAVTFLWRAAGCPEPKSMENPFGDVSPEDYYYQAVLWAVEEGITNGTSTTTFSPEAPCTRCQVAAFLWRAAGKPPASGQDNPFLDVSEGIYYYDAVLWAVNHNPQITNGIGADRFGSDNPCTRAQIVTFLYRAR